MNSVVPSALLPWLIGVPVVLVAGACVWLIFGRGRKPVAEDAYTRALEMWLAGDLDAAGELLREAIEQDPSSLDPFLQLGNLLRAQNDPRRAAILHRGLTVRPGLSASLKVSIGLALAEDLVALKRWDEVKAILDPLRSLAASNTRYWWARFAQYFGQDDVAGAARVLKKAADCCPGRDRAEFRNAHVFFQLDRAVALVRADDFGAAQRILKETSVTEEQQGLVTYVRALIAARQKDAARAITIASEGLLDRPREMALFLPALQEVLLETGMYSQTVPILEQACRSAQSAPALWIALAMLYEKLDRREEAMRLLEAKAGDDAFTPDTAAPYLKLLVGECAGTDFSRVWQALSPPATARGWACSGCGRDAGEVRWFCPECLRFDSFTARLS